MSGAVRVIGLDTAKHVFQLPDLFCEEHPLLTPFSRELFASLYEELCALDQRIKPWKNGFREYSPQTSNARGSQP